MRQIKDHVKRGRCPQCKKLRLLDHSMPMPTATDPRWRSDRPMHEEKPVRVCAECAGKRGPERREPINRTEHVVIVREHHLVGGVE
jgi:hypothetical protein